MAANLVVKFCENLKFYELRTHVYLNKSFLILIQKVIKNANINSESNQKKKIIDRTN